ncbi:MAG TPA: flagellar assembly peptidoglycan hydrolase FlgJ [Noviherbaspirillum sp.]|jgi:flagellar protein FlgJ|uniref:flagellar assembly peptidoglycan hydrolase FlgJ n=1 Tax=Noviherbaspirillum sp. TaxID=1926288 RepID=UPI002DDD4512|nr:flagellar assembly peptidoglycan hydrolase FlgJ [Noviherbaspirillum sp.]HEV2609541.1 flagellar assembly peptidoglycan hydrolase FlgJ [Noviherbaspirillum sp.]
MINPTDASARLAIDVKDAGALRQAARDNSPEALKATAKQFEALFMNMVLKSMREATPQEGMFDSQQSKMYTSMLDQQLSQTMASRGIGLADVLIRQLSSVVNTRMADEQGGLPEGPAPMNVGPSVSERVTPVDKAVQTTPSMAVDSARSNPSRPAHVREFQERLGAHADEASRATGIPAKFMLGQAALESGWGKREIRAADGTTSHNLFGIKATGGWNGRVVETATTEYVNGVPQTKIEKFRAYDSYADAFRDYARLLKNNPRYEKVLANATDVAGFAQGLQKAGYATDPNYAAKLTRIINHSLSA